jgi:diguanylate cyclase (GGDEF)-like protein
MNVKVPLGAKPSSETELDLSWTGDVQKKMVRDLYERSRAAVVTLLVLTGVIGWALAPALQASRAVQTVFALLIVVTLGRLAMAVRSQEAREQRHSVRAQFVRFTVGVAMSSVLMGALIVLSWPLLEPARLAIVAVVISGIVSGAVMSLGFSPLVYMIYMIPPVGALFLMAVTDHRPHWGAEILAASFVIYAAAVFKISLDQRRMRCKATQLEMQLSDLVVRDTLTHLHNRRFLQEFMTGESARLARDAADLAQGRQPERDCAMGIFMMDLDSFKQVNDVHGHAAGDAIIRQTADALTGAMRQSDHLVRWGGEEFVAVAWVKKPEHVRQVAEKLRKAVEDTVFVLPDGQALRKTISVGYCSMPFSIDPPRMLAWEQVLSIADAALYLAKVEGRNRWVGVTMGAALPVTKGTTCAEVVQDLLAAQEKGWVDLERMHPSPNAGQG